MERVIATRPSSAGDVLEEERMRTEFPFELPRGYVSADGTVHRQGVMRLATARDELLPLYDARVQENAAYTTVVLLARVIVRLGTLERGRRDDRGEHVRHRRRVPAGLLPSHQRRGAHPHRRDLPAVLQRVHRRSRREPPGGIVMYGTDRLVEEVSYIAFHFHWSLDDIYDLEHPDRLRFVTEIANINRRLTEGG